MCVFFFSFVANFFYICSTGCLMQWCLFRLFLRFVLHTLLLFSSSLSNSPSLLLFLLYAWIVCTGIVLCICVHVLSVYLCVCCIWNLNMHKRIQYNSDVFFFSSCNSFYWFEAFVYLSLLHLTFGVVCAPMDIMHISTMRAIFYFFFFWFFWMATEYTQNWLNLQPTYGRIKSYLAA